MEGGRKRGFCCSQLVAKDNEFGFLEAWEMYIRRCCFIG
jgi:hypothetical protein